MLPDDEVEGSIVSKGAYIPVANITEKKNIADLCLITVVSIGTGLSEEGY